MYIHFKCEILKYYFIHFFPGGQYHNATDDKRGSEITEQ